MPSLYDISVPVAINALKTQKAILQKGEAHAKSASQSPDDLLALRVAPDMLPLGMQIHIVSGTSRKLIERLTGAAPAEIEKRDDRTLGQWYGVIDETLSLLEGVDQKAVDAAEGEEVPCVLGPNSYVTSKANYVLGYTLPNVYFHLDMTYALLRGHGVEVGKRDYLAAFMAGWKETSQA